MSLRLGLLASSLLLLLAASSAASGPPPKPGPLWNEFPLDPAVTAPVPPPSAPATRVSRRTPAIEAVGEPGQVSSGGWLPFVLVGATGGLLVLSAGAMLSRRSRHQPATVVRRQITRDGLIAEAVALEREAAACNMLLDERMGRVVSMSKGPDEGVSPAEATQPEGVAPNSYAEIGVRVAGVFSAAEEAAEEIRVDARRQAAEILRLADADATVVRENAAAYEADTRAAVETYASERRRESEEELRQLVDDGQAHARATREAAEEMSRQIEGAALERQRAVYEESRSVEEQLQRTMKELRNTAERLEGLVGAEATAVASGSLVNALKPYTAGNGEDGRSTPAGSLSGEDDF